MMAGTPSLTEALRQSLANLAVERFNRDHPIGTPVTYWPGARTIQPWNPRKPKHELPGRESRTRTPAWLMSGVTPCVSVEGYPGGIALTHVEVRGMPDGR